MKRLLIILLVSVVIGFGLLAGRMLWDRALGNVPIQFFGRVIGPDGRGLSGATVNAHVTYMPLLSWPGVPFQQRQVHSMTTTTRADGTFGFSSRGLIFGINSISAPGWALWNAGGGMQTAFQYSQFHTAPAPLPDSPARAYVYKMVPADSEEAKWKMDRQPK